MTSTPNIVLILADDMGYGDLVAETDCSVGRVLDALDRNGFGGNTLVFFTSDNGSDARGLPEACRHLTNHTFRIAYPSPRAPVPGAWAPEMAPVPEQLFSLVDAMVRIGSRHARD